MSIRLLVIAIGFACALTPGCGGESERATTIEPTVTPTEAAETPDDTAALDETPTPSPTSPDDQEIDERLSEALLTLEDMPTGWTVSPPEEDEEDSGTGICGLESGQFTRDATARATANFQESEFGPMLAQIIDVFSGDDAEGTMVEFADALSSCTEWTDIDEEGAETEWQLSPLSFPKIGDETFAFRMSTVTFLGAVELDFIVWRRGDIVEVLGHTAIGFEGVDSEQTEAFVRRADEKLTAILD